MYGKTDNRREGRREKESDIHDRMGKGMERERARKRVEIINNSGSLDTTGWQACMGELMEGHNTTQHSATDEASAQKRNSCLLSNKGGDACKYECEVEW